MITTIFASPYWNEIKPTLEERSIGLKTVRGSSGKLTDSNDDKVEILFTFSHTLNKPCNHKLWFNRSQVKIQYTG